MRIILISLSLFFLTSFSIATSSSSKEISTEKESGLYSGEITKNIINITVNGMVCDFCAQSIEKVFMKRDEVKGINIRLEEQEVVIYLKKEVYIQDEVIRAMFEDAGYSVENINRDN